MNLDNDIYFVIIGVTDDSAWKIIVTNNNINEDC